MWDCSPMSAMYLGYCQPANENQMILFFIFIVTYCFKIGITSDSNDQIIQYRFTGFAAVVFMNGSHIIWRMFFFHVNIFHCCLLRTIAHLKLKNLKIARGKDLYLFRKPVTFRAVHPWVSRLAFQFPLVRNPWYHKPSK